MTGPDRRSRGERETDADRPAGTGPRTDGGTAGTDADAGVDADDTLTRVRSAWPSLAGTLGQFAPYVAVATATFALFSVVGYHAVGPTVVGDATLATEGGGVVGGRGALDYVLNNGLVAGGLIGGFGLVSLGILAFNGVTLGVAVYVGLAEGLAPATVVALIAPHGVVEIPALVLAGAVGCFLAHRVTWWALGRREEIVSATEELRFYAAVALVYAGIVVAAVIESAVTPRL